LAGIALLAVVATAERLANGLTVNAVALAALTALAAYRVGRAVAALLLALAALLLALAALVALSLGECRGGERAGD
jgi:hypothetical protein